MRGDVALMRFANQHGAFARDAEGILEGVISVWMSEAKHWRASHRGLVMPSRASNFRLRRFSCSCFVQRSRRLSFVAVLCQLASDIASEIANDTTCKAASDIQILCVGELAPCILYFVLPLSRPVAAPKPSAVLRTTKCIVLP